MNQKQVRCPHCGTINYIPDEVGADSRYICYSCRQSLMNILPSAGDVSGAVGLVGGALFGAAVAGPIGAIVGGIIGAVIGKNTKGVG